MYLTNFSTNGLMLKRHMDTLFEFRENIGTMRFSIDRDQPTYERIRVGGEFETFMKICSLSRNATLPQRIHSQSM